MKYSLMKSLLSLTPLEATVLILAGCLVVYCYLSKRIHILFFILILSASFVGSTIRGVEGAAALARFLAIVLLLVSAIGTVRLRPSPGCLLFWGYTAIGFIALFQAVNLNWQLQRCILLVLLAVAIPYVYSDMSYKSVKTSLAAASMAGAMFCLLNFIALPAQLGQAARFSGYFKGAASYAVVLGGLLPFALWGAWRGNNGVLRILCGLGFLCGVVALVFSGQRTGAVGGLIGSIPLLFMLLKRKPAVAFLLLVIAPLLLGYQLLQQGSAARGEFLLERYSLSSDSSGRTLIWKRALNEIDRYPLLGRGIGASENVIENSFHNAYLEVWFNSGLFGLFLFATSQAFFLWRSLTLMREPESIEIRSLGALALGYMVGFVLMCMFESTGAGASNVNLILYLTVGVIVSNRDLAADADHAGSDVLKTREVHA